jgi:hypothetical protein
MNPRNFVNHDHRWALSSSIHRALIATIIERKRAVVFENIKMRHGRSSFSASAYRESAQIHRCIVVQIGARRFLLG